MKRAKSKESSAESRKSCGTGVSVNYEDLLRFRINYHMRRARREQAIAQLERAFGCIVADEQPALAREIESLPEP